VKPQRSRERSRRGNKAEDGEDVKAFSRHAKKNRQEEKLKKGTRGSWTKHPRDESGLASGKKP
jgi:hypothetical protein